MIQFDFDFAHIFQMGWFNHFVAPSNILSMDEPSPTAETNVRLSSRKHLAWELRELHDFHWRWDCIPYILGRDPPIWSNAHAKKNGDDSTFLSSRDVFLDSECGNSANIFI